MSIKSAALALAFGLFSVAQAQSRVLYDVRLSTPAPKATAQENSQIKHLGRKAMAARAWDDAKSEFKVSQAGCDGSEFQILGIAPGSFTAKNTAQKAYLYTYCFFRPGSSQGLVIMQGSKAIAHYAFTALHNEMYTLKDINRNGFSELAFSGGFTGQGFTSGYLEIAELAPQRRLLGAFWAKNDRLIYEDNCGAVVDNSGTWKSLVIRVTPGTNPTYTQQSISGKCSNVQKATSTGQETRVTLNPQPTGWVSAPLN